MAKDGLKVHKRSKIRVPGTLIILAISFVLLSACSGQPVQVEETYEVIPTATLTPSPTPSPTPNPVDEDLGLEELKGMQIQFWHPWSGKTQDELLHLVDQFNQTNEWGIHVIMAAQGSAGINEQRIWDAIATIDYPEVIVVSPQMLQAIDEKTRLVVDLEDYLHSIYIGMNDDQVADFYPVFWSEDYRNGKRYGIPAQRSMSVLFYNLTWAKELGFSNVPNSPEELQTQVCSANRSMRLDADVTNDGLGGMLFSRDADTLLAWLTAFDAEIKSGDDYQFNTTATEKSYQYLLQLAQDACMLQGSNSQPYDYFSTRKALLYNGNLQDIPGQTAAEKRDNSEDLWGIIPYPGLEKNVTIADGLSYGILENSGIQNLAAWLFIRWLSEPEQQARLLPTFVTLPLSKSVIDLVPDLAAQYPQWNTAVRYITDATTPPSDADWTVVRQVIEDSAWQLFQSGTTSSQVKVILQQMDELAAELSLKYP